MKPAFDKVTALERVGDDAELLAEAAQVYLEECDGWLRELREAVAASDAVRMHRLAHTVKGAVEVFAASDAQAAALELETMGRNGTWQNVTESLAALQREMARLRPELQSLVDS